MENKIKYKDIIDLGFKEEKVDDRHYFNQYGYDYVIITKKLSKRIKLDWAKETQVCEMIRTDRDGFIKGRLVINNIKSIKAIIEFYTDKKTITTKETNPYKNLA